MKAGRRNRKVSIERMLPTRGAYGEEVEAWSSIATAWVNIKDMSGDEKVQGGKVDANITHMITLRETDVTANDRIVRGSLIYNIARVLTLGDRGAYQQLLVTQDV